MRPIRTVHIWKLDKAMNNLWISLGNLYIQLYLVNKGLSSFVSSQYTRRHNALFKGPILKHFLRGRGPPDPPPQWSPPPPLLQIASCAPEYTNNTRSEAERKEYPQS